ncbi:MAG: hypothetical protein ACE5G3_12255, partial [Gammaproteobacteria bacterium]
PRRRPAPAPPPRLYGRPLYADDPERVIGEDRLRLALSRIEMPVETWGPVMSMSRLWNAVLHDDKKREQFLASPRRFLARHGVPSDAMKRSPQEFRLLRLVCDPYVRHLAGSGNYRAFIDRLKEHDLLHDDAEDSLRHRIRAVLDTDLEQLRARLPGPAAPGAALAGLPESADLYLVTQELAAVNSTTQAVAAAAVIVVVAALAATYVSVGVNVTVVLNLGFSISVAVSVAVATGGGGGVGGIGGGGGGGGCSNCHGDFGALAGMEPKMRDNLDLTIRAARLSGRPSFETEALKDYIFTETRACLEAAESLAVIELPAGKKAREAVLRGVGRLTCRAAGLA